MKRIVVLIILFFIALLIILLLPLNDYIKTGNLYISEILAKNSSSLMDDENDYSDYIEIYNGYSFDINLKGYHLSDSEFNTNKWMFDDITIKSHEYLIIYASGKNKCNIESRICHTNFKLNSEGETITLSDSTGNIISKITYSDSSNDLSYGYSNGKYVLMNPTPGLENESKVYKSHSNRSYKVYINEYMTHNNRDNNISNGGYYDWVELYNYSDKDINLEGLNISDSEDDLNKYKLDSVVIKSKDYLVIYLTGGVNVEGYICANFKLSDNDKYIIISSNNKIIDKVPIVKLYDNISYGRIEDDWYYFSKSTPGKENNTASFKTFGGLS